MKDACVLSAVISVCNEVTDVCVCVCLFKYNHLSFSQELMFISNILFFIVKVMFKPKTLNAFYVLNV